MFGFILHLIKIMPISDGLIQAIDPLTIGLAIGGVKALGGFGQLLTAGPKAKEPEYKIPDYVPKYIQGMQEMALTGIPKQALQFDLENIQRSSLMAQRAAADRRGGLATIGTTMAQRDLSLGKLGERNANLMQQNQRNALQSFLVGAQYQDKLFANQWQSWMNKEQQRRANIGAGMQNIMGGLDLAGSMLAMGALGGAGKTPTTKTTPTAQTGRGIAGGPSISDYLATSPFNTSQIAASSNNQPLYNTSLNSYMPGSYGALMGTAGIRPRTSSTYTPVASLPGYGGAMQDLFSTQ